MILWLYFARLSFAKFHTSFLQYIIHKFISNYKNIFLRVEETQRVINLSCEREECWMNEKKLVSRFAKAIYSKYSHGSIYTFVCWFSFTHRCPSKCAESRVQQKKNIHKIMYREGNGKEIKNLVFAMHKHTKKINPRNDGEKNMHT